MEEGKKVKGGMRGRMRLLEEIINIDKRARYGMRMVSV
jgi:hypothetical protein